MAESVSPVISVRSEMLLCVSQTPNGLDLDMVKENMEGTSNLRRTSLEQGAIRHGRNKIRKRPDLCAFFCHSRPYLDFAFRRVPLLLCC